MYSVPRCNPTVTRHPATRSLLVVSTVILSSWTALVGQERRDTPKDIPVGKGVPTGRELREQRHRFEIDHVV